MQIPLLMPCCTALVLTACGNPPECKGTPVGLPMPGVGIYGLPHELDGAEQVGASIEGTVSDLGVGSTPSELQGVGFEPDKDAHWVRIDAGAAGSFVVTGGPLGFGVERGAAVSAKYFSSHPYHVSTPPQGLELWVGGELAFYYYNGGAFEAASSDPSLARAGITATRGAMQCVGQGYKLYRLNVRVGGKLAELDSSERGQVGAYDVFHVQTDNLGRSRLIIARHTSVSAPQGQDCPMLSVSSMPDVHVDFDRSVCKFTTAEASNGITLKYRLVVDQPMDDVKPERQAASPCASAHASGLFLGEKISGGDQSYCECEPQCPAGDVAPRTLEPGSYARSLSWDGRNWNGPGAGADPEGSPFPGGEYALEVSAGGQSNVIPGISASAFALRARFSFTLE